MSFQWVTYKALVRVLVNLCLVSGLVVIPSVVMAAEDALQDGWQVVAMNDQLSEEDEAMRLAALWGPDEPDDLRKKLAPPQSLLLSFVVNGDDINHYDLVYVTSTGQAYVRHTVLEAMRIAPPPAGRNPEGIGSAFRPIDRVPGLDYDIDRRTLQLNIQCAAICFKLTDLTARRQLQVAEPTPISFGGFLNYDVNVDYNDSNFDITSLFELGLFSEQGSFRTTFAGRDLANSASALRLETSFTIDDTEKRRRLVLGDSITRNAVWSQPVRFAGVRYGNEFSMTPGFVTLPSPDFSGEAALPSTIDVFVKGVRRFTADVPAGPFQVRDLPVLTGTGEAQIIVRDVLGREQVYTESYALDRAMLRSGLSDWSVSAGFVREAFAARSGNYGGAFIDALYAEGLSDQLTYEVQGQWSRDVMTSGVGLTYGAPGLGVVTGTLALSRTDKDEGLYWGIGWNWAHGGFSFSTNFESATPHFRTLGQNLADQADKYRFQVRSSWRVGDGNISASYVDLKRRDSADFRSVSVGYTTRISRRFSMSLNGFSQFEPFRSDTVLLSLTASLGDGASIGASAKKERAGGYSISGSYHQSPPIEGGFGYRLRAGRDDRTRFSDGTLNYRGDVIETSFGWSEAFGDTQLRGTARGGIVMAEGYVRPARYVTSSFAIVDVADLEGVRIYTDRRYAGRTGRDGTLAVTQLRAWEENIISIEGADLPLDWPVTQFDYSIVPSNRTGHFIKIEGGTGRSVVMRLQRADGSYPPVGAVIKVPGGEESFYVGEQGYSFVAGIKESATLDVIWPAGSCTASIDLPDSEVPQIMLGEVTCY